MVTVRCIKATGLARNAAPASQSFRLNQTELLRFIAVIVTGKNAAISDRIIISVNEKHIQVIGLVHLVALV